MIYPLEKIKWLYEEWQKNRECKFQMRQVKKKGHTSNLGYAGIVAGFEEVQKRVRLWGRIQWEVGRDYAVQPGGGKVGVSLHPDGSLNWRGDSLLTPGARRLRTLVTDIGEEPLRDISEKDCLAEGVVYYPGPESPWGCMPPYNPDRPWGHFGKGGGWLTPERAYEAMWDGLKPKKGHRFADNPTVFAISFELRAM